MPARAFSGSKRSSIVARLPRSLSALLARPAMSSLSIRFVSARLLATSIFIPSRLWPVLATIWVSPVALETSPSA